MNPLTFSEKLAVGLWSISALVFISVVYFFWWEKQPPPRPKSLPPTAVYYSGLAVPFVVNKHGAWVYCWFDFKQNSDRCQVTFVDGTLLYEDIFLPYRRHTPVPQDELLIDPELMNTAQEQVEVNAAPQESPMPDTKVVPLVFLRNREVLIPEKAFETGKKQLDAKEHSVGGR